ncbi:MAG: DUF814 domain-containing protein [Candidatus Eisenbacteria bacterium]|uniref:DUF814 domain-containing protein n=1 Tax=Eiseniibacteriota bacterium TaxID=2212470 RepID=A0A849SU25_UNCEI|nr:DUF814 domain-containing protein [Candidatus Eisenbacteria bacterium]
MSQPPNDVSERRTQLTRVLKKQHARLARKVEGLKRDLAEAELASELRRAGETLLTYVKQVPPRATEVTLPDPSNQEHNLSIVLDPMVSAQVNAARYFKRAAKAERGLKEVPPRLRAVEADVHALAVLLARVAALEEGASDNALIDDGALDGDLESALASLSEMQRGGLVPKRVRAQTDANDAGSAAARAAKPKPLPGALLGKGRERVPARLMPRRLKTREGWDVLIGRSNEGNDYVTHHLARSEDYWFHVHGSPGSHVVLRRGKGANEPSKATIDEVSAWAAFYSQARTAGKVPVIVTRKKYVRKPRKGPPGLAVCTNEKTVIVRPVEPPRESLADFVEPDQAEPEQ